MCGIAGLTGPWGDDPSPIVTDMVRCLSHRGPDAQGVWAGGGAVLGHARLSIVDVEGGRQPMTSEDGRVVVVFNGEIYNHQRLRRDLAGAGHTFRTRCDTEAIVHLYERDGVDFVHSLDGMFAVAVWDATNRRLVLARDRLGQKPLVYWRSGERLAFASELEALRRAGLPGEIDAAGLDEYLAFGAIHAPRTIYAAARKLEPASRLVFENGGATVDRYWSIDPAIVRPRTADEVRAMVERAVADRLMSDVPLGAFLSGGIDSSIVVASMARASADPVRTFSIGFGDPRYSELPRAAAVAGRYKTRHREFVVEPDAAEIAPMLACRFGEPFGDSSAIPTYYVARAAAESVKVALSGDGGDELFGGYERYAALRLADRLGRWGLSGVLSSRPVLGALGRGGHPKSLRVAARRFLSSLRVDDAERYFGYLALMSAADRRRLLRDDWRGRVTAGEVEGEFRRRFDAASGRDLLTRASLADMLMYLPGDLLTKVDICGMANSLEIRCPFLDHRLVEAALALPAAAKCRHWQGKRILRRAFAAELPRAVTAGRKMGFAVPVGAWLRSSLQGWMRELLRGPSSLSGELVEPKEVDRLIEEHVSGRKDRAAELWSLAMLELWMRGG